MTGEKKNGLDLKGNEIKDNKDKSSPTIIVGTPDPYFNWNDIYTGGLTKSLYGPNNMIIGSEPHYRTGIYFNDLIANDNPVFKSSIELDNEINRLNNERSNLINKLKDAEDEIKKHKRSKSEIEEARRKQQEDLDKFKELNEEIQKKLDLGSLLTQVNNEARLKLFQDKNFLSLFTDTKNCNSFVLSIDIRRSTELMLKAKIPELFERFIVELSDKLSQIIIQNYGIFDKFTGDGILAFFPNFFSGEDAGLMALKSAIECHKVFNDHYKSNRHCFISVLTDIGLGIGVDYGNTYLVKMGGAYTVIGTPVVYACRMSGAQPGDTLLNQPAFEIIFKDYKQYFNFSEVTITIKNEGSTLGYKITSNGSKLDIKKPKWTE